MADLRAFHEGQPAPAAPAAAPAPAAPAAPEGVLARLSHVPGDMAGVSENILSAATGAIAQPVSGLVGLARLPFVGPEQATRDINGVQNAMTYSPRTEGGKGGQQAIANVTGAASDALHRALPDNPAAQTFIPAALEAAATVGPLGKGLVSARLARNATEAAAATAAREAPTPMQRATQSGFQIAPNDVAQTTGTPISAVKGSTVQNLTETPGTLAARRQANVSQATQIGAREMRIPATDQITPEHVEAAKSAAGATRDQLAQSVGPMSDPLLPDTVQALQDAVSEDRPQNAVAAATKRDVPRMIAGLQSGQYPGKQVFKDVQFLRNDGSPAAMQAASALENEMENQLKGQPDTLADFQDNRTHFAKIYDVEAALKNNRLDPQAMLRQRDTWERPLTDGLEEIANAASVAPNSVRMPSPVVGESTPMSKVGVLSSVGKAIAGKVLPDNATPARQAAIAGSARAPGMLPEAAGSSTTAPVPPLALGTPPGAAGAAPRQLGLELAPGRPAPPQFGLEAPPGAVFEPAQRANALPQGRGAINLSRQILRQIQLRNGQLPGTLENGE